MAVFVRDTFTDPDGTSLLSHTGEVGATWVTHSIAPTYGTPQIYNGRYFSDHTTNVLASGIPGTDEYDVQVDVYRASVLIGRTHRIQARWGTSSTSSYSLNLTQDGISLSRLSGGETVLATYAAPEVAGTTDTVKLEIRNASKKIYLNGVVVGSSTDNAITGAGRVGIYMPYETSQTTGRHYDNFIATDLTPDGPEPVTLDAAGSIAASSDLAGATTLTATAGAAIATATTLTAGTTTAQTLATADGITATTDASVDATRHVALATGAAAQATSGADAATALTIGASGIVTTTTTMQAIASTGTVLTAATAIMAATGIDARAALDLASAAALQETTDATADARTEATTAAALALDTDMAAATLIALTMTPALSATFAMQVALAGVAVTPGVTFTAHDTPAQYTASDTTPIFIAGDTT